MATLNNLGTLQGLQSLKGGKEDYLLYCLDNYETDVCRYMMDNIGFPKLEAGLSSMPFEDFSDCLAYTHLKVKFSLICFILRTELLRSEVIHFFSFLTFLQGFFPEKGPKIQEKY